LPGGFPVSEVGGDEDAAEEDGKEDGCELEDG